MSYVHFKMEALQLFLELITPVCFMASLNLKDAYYSILINLVHTKYISFYCYPMVYAEGPITLTKLTKPLIAVLRR